MKEKEILENLIEELRNSKSPIIVEGKKDEKALRSLGITNIHPISRKPIQKFAEEIALKYKEVIILTDIDKEGKKLLARLLEAFDRLGIKVNRNILKELQKTKLRVVEGIKKRAIKLGIKKVWEV